MVKGISRQVIVVHPPGEALFDEAIFILKEETGPVTDEQLLRQAGQALRAERPAKRRLALYGPVWACGGALLTGAVWLLSTFF